MNPTASSFHKDQVLDWLLHYMSQETRQRLMRELPVAYNDVVGQAVAVGVRIRDVVTREQVLHVLDDQHADGVVCVLHDCAEYFNDQLKNDGTDDHAPERQHGCNMNCALDKVVPLLRHLREAHVGVQLFDIVSRDELLALLDHPDDNAFDALDEAFRHVTVPVLICRIGEARHNLAALLERLGVTK